MVVKQVLGDRGQKSPVALPRHLGGREFGSTSVARRTNRKNSTDTSSTRKTPRREGTTRLSGPCRPCGVGPRVADPREHTTPRFSLTIPSTTTDPNGHVQDCWHSSVNHRSYGQTVRRETGRTRPLLRCTLRDRTWVVHPQTSRRTLWNKEYVLSFVVRTDNPDDTQWRYRVLGRCKTPVVVSWATTMTLNCTSPLREIAVVRLMTVGVTRPVHRSPRRVRSTPKTPKFLTLPTDLIYVSEQYKDPKNTGKGTMTSFPFLFHDSSR